MKLVFAAVAEGANLTKSGSLNVLSMFTELQTPAVPTTCPLLNVIFWFETEGVNHGDEYEIGLRIFGDEGEAVSIEGQVQIHKHGQASVVPLTVPIAVVSFPKEGKYTVEVKSKESTVFCDFFVRVAS